MSLAKKIFDKRTAFYKHALGKRVAFHHVPKCAGTSVSRALRKRYALSQHSVGAPLTSTTTERVFGANADTQRTFRIALFDYLIEKDYFFVGGHVPFYRPTFDAFESGRHYVTVLRDPVERFISEYNYNYRKRSLSGGPLSLEEFVQTREAVLYGSRYTEYFCGTLTYDGATSVLAKKAKDNLDCFSVIGLVGDMDIFAYNLKNILGVNVKIPKENVGGADSSEKRKAVGADMIAEIQQLCANDIDIYEHVLAKSSRSSRLR